MTDQGSGPIEDLLDGLRERLQPLRDGQIATYIPQLATADPETFGLALATLDGHVYEAGSQTPFTIQSVSKPFVYALAIADRGLETVLQHVGVEPSGDPFNQISLDERTSRPFNPMVNAGAIVTTSLVAGSRADHRAEQFERIHTGLSAFAGRDLGIDDTVFTSERDTGDRNRAIAYLMRTADLLDADVDAILDVYFRQCAILVTARDLAVMAATLAGGGINPVTGVQVVPREVVGRVLTVMTTCGMYDYAGEWLYRVGLPAKSGVSGGISAVLPGQLGLGSHSPLLDERGNSVRGIAAFDELSSHFALHMLQSGVRVPGGPRGTRRLDTTRSQRVRVAAERDALDVHGRRIALDELAGDQVFATVERLIRAVREDPEPAAWRILDLHRVTRLDAASIGLLTAFVAHLRQPSVDAKGATVVLVPPSAVTARREVGVLDADHVAHDVEQALEWCEAALLGELGLAATAGLPDAKVELADADLLSGLPAEAVARIAERTTTLVIPAGQIVFAEGSVADGMYFVAAGQVAADIRTAAGTRRRLSTIGPGSSFGELALVDGSPRSTRIVTDDPTLLHHLSSAAFAELERSDPAVALELYRAIAISLSARMRRATAQLAASGG